MFSLARSFDLNIEAAFDAASTSLDRSSKNDFNDRTSFFA
jgi:hypothetical protein